MIQTKKLTVFKRLECELPETPDRFQDQASAWPDSNGAIPSIEERLLHLEHGMGEMIHLMRQMVNNTSNLAGSPRSQATRSLDESTSGEIGALPPFTIKPVQFIRDLQLECFSGRDGLTGDADIIGDVVSLGIIDIKLSYKLMEL